MRELRSFSNNTSFIQTEKGWVPMVEVILLLAEPVYGADAGGITKTRTITDSRFHTTSHALREFAASLVELADSADKELEEALQKTTIAPKK